MSYPSQKRRLRPARGIAAAIAALLAAGAGLAAMPAQAVPTPEGPAGWIRTMGGVTRNYTQGGYGPEGALAIESQFSNPRGLNFAPNGDLYVTDALNHRVRKIDADGRPARPAPAAMRLATTAAMPRAGRSRRF